MSQKFKRIREHLSGLFFSIFWAVIIAALLVIYFSSYNLFGGSADSARYLLSALAQSQAAIVAIVITLTLVAVQLASQTYSPRVMDLFLKSFAFWILLLFYGLSIMYNFILLDMITEGNINSFACLVNFGVVLMAGTFSALFWYVKETIEQLKPDAIIDRLGGDVRKELKSFVEAVYEKYEGSENNYSLRMLNENEDKILSLIDITKKAIRVDDLTTARYGIEKLRDICSDIVGSDEFKSDQKEGIVNHFSEHFIRISDIAFDQKDEDSAAEITDSLGKIGERVAEKKLGKAIVHVLKSLRKIAIKAVENNWGVIVESSIDIFSSIHVKAGEKKILRTGYEAPISVIEANIWYIVEAAIKKGPGFATDYVAKPLKEFCIKAIEMAVNNLSGENFDQVLINTSFKIAGGIAYIGEKAIEKEDRVIEDVVRYLAEIGTELAKAEDVSFKHSRSIITVHLSKIIDKSMSKGERYVEEWVIIPLGNFGSNLYNKYTFGIEFDRRIEELPIKDQRRIEVEYRWIMSCLEEIGLKVTSKQLDSATKWLIKSIIDCSENHRINGLNNAPKYAAQSLVKIATKGRKEDMVENIFEEHFKSIKELQNNREAFKELKEIYENELKK